MSSAPRRGLSTIRYAFDPTVSRFTVQAFAAGLLSSFGHNPTIGLRDFQGTVEFVSGTYENTRIHMKVNTSRCEVLDQLKTSDREKIEREMYGVVLKADRYPCAIFESNQVEMRSAMTNPFAVQVKGELTLCGVTRRHMFGARVSNLESSLRIAGEFALRQSNYGIKPVSLAGGIFKLKDELKFQFEIIARRETLNTEA